MQLLRSLRRQWKICQSPWTARAGCARPRSNDGLSWRSLSAAECPAPSLPSGLASSIRPWPVGCSGIAVQNGRVVPERCACWKGWWSRRTAAVNPPWRRCSFLVGRGWRFTTSSRPPWLRSFWGPWRGHAELLRQPQGVRGGGTVRHAQRLQRSARAGDGGSWARARARARCSCSATGGIRASRFSAGTARACGCFPDQAAGGGRTFSWPKHLESGVSKLRLDTPGVGAADRRGGFARGKNRCVRGMNGTRREKVCAKFE